MLTVLIRYRKTHREVLIPARTVEYVPKGKQDSGLLINHGVQAEGGSHLKHDDCTDDVRDVFVMNAQGQTVARYTL